MDYRREIDGLRAVAVVSVVLFHAGLQTFSGGYVGVDVFFVISGYLITSIILAEKQAGTFSLARFYERRARRILPLLFLVMLVCLPASWLWLWPSDFKDFARSLVHVTLFVSNVHFYKESGYFDPEISLKPLLHTWTLGVEEQYYILFPLIVMLAWRMGRQWLLAMLSVMAMASFAAAEWGLYAEPQAAFYLLPTRAWELLIGVFVAFSLTSRTDALIRPERLGNGAAQAFSALGLLLIGGAVLLLDEGTPFPSVYALLPTLGAALIILFARPQTVVGSLLGSRPLVAIGLISYGTYLWHQPLFAFARYRSIDDPGPGLLLPLALMAVALAWASWRYVETPCRNKSVVSRGAITALAIGGALFFLAIGWAAKQYGGAVGRVTGDQRLMLSIEQKLANNRGLAKSCSSFQPAEECVHGNQPEILVWGDSFAMHLVEGVVASSRNAQFVQKTKSECGPVVGIAPLKRSGDLQWAKDCMQFNSQVMDWLQAHPSIKHAVVASPFSVYLSEGSRLLAGGHIVPATDEVVLDAFLYTLRALRERGIEPVVFAPPPANGKDLGKCLARMEYYGQPLARCDFSAAQISPIRRRAYALLEAVDRDYKVVWPHRYLCKTGVCRTHDGMTFYYRDRAHLSREGAAALGVQMGFYRQIVE